MRGMPGMFTRKTIRPGAHPEDEEALISYKYYLRGLQTFEEDGILYVLAEEVAR